MEEPVNVPNEKIKVYVVTPDAKYDKPIVGMFSRCMHNYDPVFIRTLDEVTTHAHSLIILAEPNENGTAVTVRAGDSDESKNFVTLMHKNVEKHNKISEAYEMRKRPMDFLWETPRTHEQVMESYQQFGKSQIAKTIN